MFMGLFKSKKTKEQERLQMQYAELLSKAVDQLQSSKQEHQQVMWFLKLLRDRCSLGWRISVLQNLVGNKLSDGSPILSKFFLREADMSQTKCRIAIHDSSILEPIKELGFSIMRLGGPNIFEKDVGQQAAKGLFLMEFCNEYDMSMIVEKCNQYYDALLKVKDRIASREVICVPKYTKIEWGCENFNFETDLTPSRVDDIVASLPKDCKYLKEYREFLINRLAVASIRENPTIGRNLKTIAYNQPVVYCWTYSDFEKRHLKELAYQAKNKEFETVIDEVRESAQKKIETEI